MSINIFLCQENNKRNGPLVHLSGKYVRSYVCPYVPKSCGTYVRLSVRPEILWTQLLLNRMADFAKTSRDEQP
jgi:hypothetical protein